MHTGPAAHPPDVLVPLDVEAVEVVVWHIAPVATLLEPLNDGQLHAHGDVGRQYGEQQVLLGTGGDRQDHVSPRSGLPGLRFPALLPALPTTASPSAGRHLPQVHILPRPRQPPRGEACKGVQPCAPCTRCSTGV